jgi:hypothetical protein
LISSGSTAGSTIGIVTPATSCSGCATPGGTTGRNGTGDACPETGAGPDDGALLGEARKFWSLAWSTARSTLHCGQRKRARPWGTLRTAWQCAQGSWIFVGSTPWAGGAPFRGCVGGGREGFAGDLGGGDDDEDELDLGISCGGRRCAMRHLGQMNSVTPGPTARTPWQPAQRTCTGAAAGEVDEPPAIGGDRTARVSGQGSGGVWSRFPSSLGKSRRETETARPEVGWFVWPGIWRFQGLLGAKWKLNREENSPKMRFKAPPGKNEIWNSFLFLFWAVYYHFLC